MCRNHDAANKKAMPLYVQNGGGYSETKGARIAGGNATLDSCLSTLDKLCPTHRGESFHCMTCADEVCSQLGGAAADWPFQSQHAEPPEIGFCSTALR